MLFTILLGLLVFSLITVTYRLFTQIVSTEKMRKDMRKRKDMRGTNYTVLAVF